MTMNKSFFLFLVILIEGYVVLSSELLAIRQTMPFVGSGTDTISIIIAAVLLPLAVGYYAGGRYRDDSRAMGKHRSIRQKLVNNILISSIILFPGLSHVCLVEFFNTMIDIGITNRLAMVTIYSLIFLVTPVYLLGQTIPLVSNYFSKDTLARITGRMLFFSTVGSFLGAVFSTLILMAFLGVNETAALNFIFLAILASILSHKRKPHPARITIMCAVLAVVVNSDVALAQFNIVSNNQYNMIRLFERPDTGTRLLSINNNNSSIITKDGKANYYVLLTENRFLNKIDIEADPIRILLIGAGGFTFGLLDDYNHYDLVDIDPALEDIAQNDFLRQELTENKHFHAKPARGFLAEIKEPYDLIFVDAFSGNTQIPEHLITQEFFQEVKDSLTEDGAVVFNMILSPTLDDPFSQHIDDTLRSVFPYINRDIIHEHSGWGNRRSDVEETQKDSNILYSYVQKDEINPTIYSDLKNPSFWETNKTREKMGVGY